MIKIFTTFIIIFTFPLAVLNYFHRHRFVSVSVATVMIFVLFLVCCSKTDGDDPDVIDYTYAFNTGVKRTANTEYIVLHHVAGTAKISDIIKIHYKQNGWNGVGYHFFVDTDGKIYQLRDTDEKAPHTLNYNSSAIGICFNGNLSETEPTPEQWKSGLKLVRKMMARYNLGANNVLKHGDLNTTECCGKMFNVDKFKEEL